MWRSFAKNWIEFSIFFCGWLFQPIPYSKTIQKLNWLIAIFYTTSICHSQPIDKLVDSFAICVLNIHIFFSSLSGVGGLVNFKKVNEWLEPANIFLLLYRGYKQVNI